MYEDKPSYEDVARELKCRLYHRTGEPDSTDEGVGRVFTLSYDQLYSLSKRQKFTKAFYANVEWYAWNIGIIVGFGEYGITVATDDHFAPDGLGNLS